MRSGGLTSEMVLWPDQPAARHESEEYCDSNQCDDHARIAANCDSEIPEPVHVFPPIVRLTSLLLSTDSPGCFRLFSSRTRHAFHLLLKLRSVILSIWWFGRDRVVCTRRQPTFAGPSYIFMPRLRRRFSDQLIKYQITSGREYPLA